MIALLLVLALVPGAAPAASKGAKAAPAPAAKAPAPAANAPAPAPAPAPAEVPPPAGSQTEVLEEDVLGFLSLTQTTSSRDGGVKLPWDGPGGPQLKLSWDALEKRNEALAMGDMMARALVEAVRQFYDTEGGVDPEAMKAKLRNMVGGPMEEARQSYIDAVTWEERRLFFIERAVRDAEAQKTALPGVDPSLVLRRAKAIRSGAMKKAVLAKVDGYRDLALGLVNYLDGDNFGALEKVRNAAQTLPDFAVAHAFLGSIYFLFDQKEAAVASWRRAFELDPTNQAVAEALKEHGRPKRQSKTTRPAGKDDR